VADEVDASDPAVSMLANDRASAELGMQLEALGPGHATVTMRVEEWMLNGHEIAHGGFVFALADTAFACACNSGRSTTVAATAEIDYLAPAAAGELLVAEARERVAYGRSGITDVTVWRREPDEARIAEFRGRSRTLRREDG
jgi:phenylacetic acid degradation protein PaaD